MGYEWQTIALYGALLLVVIITLWRWHTSPKFENFCLLHFVANREGYVDPDRAFLTGSFLIAAFATVVSVIRDKVDQNVVLLVGGLVSAFALKQGWSYTVAKRTDTDVRTAEIKRGRRDDPEETVEEEDAKKERRRSLLK